MSTCIDNIKFVFASYAMIIIAFFAPALTSIYAFTDDFSAVATTFDHSGSPFMFDVMSGRPLFGAFRYITWKFMTGIGDLGFNRAFSVATLILLAVLINRFISSREIFSNKAYNYFFPLLIVLLPSFQVYSAWATCFPFTLAVLFSGMAYMMLECGKVKKTHLKLLISFVLITLSFAIYQPSGMTFIAFALIDTCLNKEKVRWPKLFQSGFIMALGVFSSLIMIKVIPFIAYGQVMSRATMTNDFFGKINWFFCEAVINALSTYNINPSFEFRYYTIPVFVVGLLFIILNKNGWLKVLMSIAMIIVSYAPNLYVGENWAAQRSLVAMEISITAIMLYGIFSLSERIISLCKVDFSSYLGVALTVFAGIIASSNINNGFVINQISEQQSVASEISNKVSKDFKGELKVDLSKRTWGTFSKDVRYDEFGENSVYAPWATRGVLLNIKHAKGFNYRVPQDIIISPQNPCGEGCITISPYNAMMNATMAY